LIRIGPGLAAQELQTLIYRTFALTAVKCRSAKALNLTGRGRTTTCSAVNLFRIDVIANAMDHGFSLLQLRMIVNYF
jgi:hypothetical protein